MSIGARVQALQSIIAILGSKAVSIRCHTSNPNAGNEHYPASRIKITDLPGKSILRLV